MINYRPLLKQWSIELLASSLSERIESPPQAPDWLGSEPATAADVSELEARLGLLLPPSYKAFLQTSNGWGRISPFIGRLRPAAEVEWFRIENESWAEVYAESGWDVPDEEYYAYVHEGSAPGDRAEHMATLVQISDVDDGVFLLNPQAVTPDGEWEAWFFANWVPGAERYPSFAHLLKRTYLSFHGLENIATKPARWPELPVPGPNVPRVPAERVGKIKAAESLDELLKQIQSPDRAVRERALRRFHGKLKGRPRGQRRPDLIAPLEALFSTSSDSEVRVACLSAMIELADDDAPPKSLLAGLSDEDPNVATTAMYALYYFPDSRALAPLCRFIESRRNQPYNENAIGHLGNMKNPAAIPTLRGVLLDTANTFDQSFGSAGLALGRIGGKAIPILIAALDHADPRVRFGAVVGLDVSGDDRASAHLDRMLDDPDPKVRMRAGHRMGRYPGDL